MLPVIMLMVAVVIDDGTALCPTCARLYHFPTLLQAVRRDFCYNDGTAVVSTDQEFGIDIYTTSWLKYNDAGYRGLLGRTYDAQSVLRLIFIGGSCAHPEQGQLQGIIYAPHPDYDFTPPSGCIVDGSQLESQVYFIGDWGSLCEVKVADATSSLLCPTCPSLFGYPSLLHDVRTVYCAADATVWVSNDPANPLILHASSPVRSDYTRQHLGERFTNQAVLELIFTSGCNHIIPSTGIVVINEPLTGAVGEYDILPECMDDRATFYIGDWSKLCVLDPCRENPCLNGGQCSAAEEGDNEWTCTCVHGFIGVNCNATAALACAVCKPLRLYPGVQEAIRQTYCYEDKTMLVVFGFGADARTECDVCEQTTDACNDYTHPTNVLPVGSAQTTCSTTPSSDNMIQTVARFVPADFYSEHAIITVGSTNCGNGYAYEIRHLYVYERGTPQTPPSGIYPTCFYDGQEYWQTYKVANWTQLCDDNTVCASSPCQHGGTCTRVGTTDTCDCTPPYLGVHCEYLRGDCAVDDDCQNGGTCVSASVGFVCKCVVGFDGIHCETPSDPHCPGCTARFEDPQLIARYQGAFCDGGTPNNIQPLPHDVVCRQCWYAWRRTDNPTCTPGPNVLSEYFSQGWPKYAMECTNPNNESRVIITTSYMGLTSSKLYNATPQVLLMSSCLAATAAETTLYYTEEIWPPPTGEVTPRCSSNALARYRDDTMCNPCYHDRCQNGGTCNALFLSDRSVYTCTCLQGYAGTNCEIGCWPRHYDSCPCEQVPYTYIRELNGVVDITTRVCTTRPSYIGTFYVMWYKNDAAPGLQTYAHWAGLRTFTDLQYTDTGTPYVVMMSCLRNVHITVSGVQIDIKAGVPMYAVMARHYQNNGQPGVPFATDDAYWPAHNTTGVVDLTATYVSDAPIEASMYRNLTPWDVDDSCLEVRGYAPRIRNCSLHNCDPHTCSRYHAICIYDHDTGACRSYTCSDHHKNAASCKATPNCTYTECNGRCHDPSEPLACSSFVTDECTHHGCDHWTYFSPPVCVERGLLPACGHFSRADCSLVGCHWSTMYSRCSDNVTSVCERHTTNATCNAEAGCRYHQDACMLCMPGRARATATFATPVMVPTTSTAPAGATATTTTTMTAAPVLQEGDVWFAGSESIVGGVGLALCIIAIITVYATVAYRRAHTKWSIYTQ